MIQYDLKIVLNRHKLAPHHPMLALNRLKIALHRPMMALSHNKVALYHRIITLNRHKIARRHRSIALNHHKIALRHLMVALNHRKIAPHLRRVKPQHRTFDRSHHMIVENRRALKTQSTIAGCRNQMLKNSHLIALLHKLPNQQAISLTHPKPMFSLRV